MHRPVEFKILLEGRETTYTSTSNLGQLTERIGVLSDQEDLGLERENAFELRLDSVIPFSGKRGVDAAVWCLKVIDLYELHWEYPELDESVWVASILAYLGASEFITTKWNRHADGALGSSFQRLQIAEINEFAKLIVLYQESRRIPSLPWLDYLARCEPWLFGSFATPVLDGYDHVVGRRRHSMEPSNFEEDVLVSGSIKIPLHVWPECLPQPMPVSGNPMPGWLRNYDLRVLRFVVVNSDERKRRMYVMITYAYTFPESKHTFHAVFELTQPLRLVHVVKTCGTKHPIKNTKINRFILEHDCHRKYLQEKDVCNTSVVHRFDRNTVRFDLFVCGPETTRMGFVLRMDDGTVEPSSPTGLELRSGKSVFPSGRLRDPYDPWTDEPNTRFTAESFVEYV